MRILELGGGGNRHPATDVNVDLRPETGVDFTADFNQPLPITSNDFDGVIAIFVLEHISYRKTKQFIAEMLRVIKPGTKAVVITPNTEAQIQWIKDHPEGWDGKPLFESASCIIFGDQDYAGNFHSAYLSPPVAFALFQEAGFDNIVIRPYGAANTDMCIEATKPAVAKQPEPVIEQSKQLEPVKQEEDKVAANKEAIKGMKREEVFDRNYFNGGGKIGGYAREGIWDFPAHSLTAQHVLDRKPESVVEIGCARGYILKRLQDAGVNAHGIEISKHCYLTRVADKIINQDICETPWPFANEQKLDLCFSIATLEHIPEEFVEPIIKEMARCCKRGMHGIDFGGNDDGFDKSHVCLKPKAWWREQFEKHAPGWPVEIIDKEELERGQYKPELFTGDGKVKVNVGSFTTQCHHGWINLDVHDLAAYAQAYNYKYQRCDVRAGLPFATSSVDMIHSSHMLEHLTYKEGASFLRECRRVIKPDGIMRFILPDAELLMGMYANEARDVVGNRIGYAVEGSLSEFDEVNQGCAESPTAAGKLWSLLHEGHAACYDMETLSRVVREAGFVACPSGFRLPLYNKFEQSKQLLRETLDMLPSLSLYMWVFPAME